MGGGGGGGGFHPYRKSFSKGFPKDFRKGFLGRGQTFEKRIAGQIIWLCDHHCVYLLEELGDVSEKEQNDF